MNWFDIAILAVVLLFAVIGTVRGFMREVLSLVSWVLAFWVAFTFADPVSVLFESYIDAPVLRVIASFASLFVSTLLLLTIVSFLLHKLLSVSGIKGTDRVLGGLFGALKGVVIVAALMLLANETVLPQEDWWSSSLLAVHFEPLILIIKDLLPANMAAGFQGA